MDKQYKVVVPFGGNKAGDILDSIPTKGGETWVHVKNTRGAMYGILAEFISDKLEEVKPRALRKWLVEEVATREEATDAEHTNKTYASGDGLYVSRSWVEKLGDSFVWVKITEQKEREEIVGPPAGWNPFGLAKLERFWWVTEDNRIENPAWFGDRFDKRIFDEGRAFKTEEEAKAFIGEKRWVPKVGDRYWTTSHGLDDCRSDTVELGWEGDVLDLRWLEEGDVFKTEEECQAYIDSKKKAA